MSTRNEIEAMNIIINIQAMQDAIHGKHFEHSAFNANTIDELRALQSRMITEYNEAIKQKQRVLTPEQEKNISQLARFASIGNQMAILAHEINTEIEIMLPMLQAHAERELKKLRNKG